VAVGVADDLLDRLCLHIGLEDAESQQAVEEAPFNRIRIKDQRNVGGGRATLVCGHLVVDQDSNALLVLPARGEKLSLAEKAADGGPNLLAKYAFGLPIDDRGGAGEYCPGERPT
jgi:hypothetical protein